MGLLIRTSDLLAGRRRQAWREVVCFELFGLTPDMASVVIAPDAAIAQPTLVLTGDRSPTWMAAAGGDGAVAIPDTVHRVLPDQAHDVSAPAFAAELLEFFTRR